MQIGELVNPCNQIAGVNLPSLPPPDKVKPKHTKIYAAEGEEAKKAFQNEIPEMRNFLSFSFSSRRKI